jgi:hypothetical protein
LRLPGLAVVRKLMIVDLGSTDASQLFALAATILPSVARIGLLANRIAAIAARRFEFRTDHKQELAMTARKLKKKEWKPFFDGLSKVLGVKEAEIEVLSLNLGDQVEAEWVRLIGLTYDPKDDLLDVALEGLDHLIPKPREISVEDGGVGLASVAVVDAEGVRHVIKLRDPMALPSPQES